MTGKPTIELFYDIVSPYSYIAFEILCQNKEKINLVLKPAFLGGVMKASGNRPPAAVPFKGLWMSKDLSRSSKMLGIKMVSIPEVFPENTILSMRALTVLKKLHPEFLERASRELWKKHWGEGKSIGSQEVILEALQRAGVSDTASRACLEAAASQEIKEELVRATQEAIDTQCFGFPWMLVSKSGEDTKEPFFGSDRFDHIENLLGINIKIWSSKL